MSVWRVRGHIYIEKYLKKHRQKSNMEIVETEANIDTLN